MPFNQRLTKRIEKTSDHTALLPCPCCGSDDVQLKDADVPRPIVSCLRCGLNTGTRATATIAIGTWNRRTPHA